MIKQFPLTFALILERKLAMKQACDLASPYLFNLFLSNLQTQRLHKKKATKTFIKAY